MHQSVLPMTSCKQSPAHGVGKEVIVSIQLSTSAPAAGWVHFDYWYNTFMLL
ncbi:MAG: hypothetical protein HYV97_17905 [Bdellovibrio sp.]|nr:hypothetical protein [Bdellovibrio sp.]